jgi:oligogalacturonide lyase
MPTFLNRLSRRAGLTLACTAALIQFGIAAAFAQTEPSATSSQPDGIDLIWQQHSEDPNLCWRDPGSGARVVCVAGGFDRLSLPYFHQNVFTAAGDLMLFTGAHGKAEGYYLLNLKTGAIRQISDQVGQHLVVLPHRRCAIFNQGDDVFSLNLDSGQIRHLLTVPHGLLDQAAGFGFTADESKLLFAYCDQLNATMKEVTAKPAPRDQHFRRVDWVEAYEKMPRHNALYSIDLDAGELTPLFRDGDSNWLGHVQGSPTDSNLAIFIHEGFVSVHIKNRLRVLDLGTGQVTMPRTGPLELDSITHEFWDRDGHSVWYDIGSAEALGHLDLRTGVETRYAYGAGTDRANRSIHYAIGRDGKWAVGDGGQWGNTWLCLYQFDQRDPQTGKVPIKHLCDFAPTYNNVNASYIEPNPHLTPDFRWVLFTAHLKGNENKVYAVEIPATAGAGN